MPVTGLVWFSHDLRLHDNAVVAEAAKLCDRLLFVAVVDPAQRKPNRYGMRSLGDHRQQFLHESLEDLGRELASRSQHLLVMHGNPIEEITALVKRFNVRCVFRSEPIGVFEQWQCDMFKRVAPDVRLVLRNTHTLFMRSQLPFLLVELPETFSQFRKKVDAVEVLAPAPAPTDLKRPPLLPAELLQSSAAAAPTNQTTAVFRGGVNAGQAHLARYLDRGLPRTYKQVRNELDGFDNSSKWSPWLAHGCLSAREVLHALRTWQSENGRCGSSDWLHFELLWREYFQWYALTHGRALFAFRGIRNKRPLTSHYASRFAAWRSGTTPYPLVNACMRELAATGYLSNRGRQIVASCFVNELSLDWRYGAAWFEEQLIDYDVAVNWGNWQYLAGVGADPKGLRHFNLEKQAQIYDASGEYRRRWGATHDHFQLDTIDAADWPLIQAE